MSLPQASRLVGAGAGRQKNFSFATGNLVLVKWEDGMVYFAKIKRIDRKNEKCIVVFDDKSQDEADFRQIHSVDETTTDIICIKCKKDNSDSPNEIVLCDMCGIGFHRKCHTPPIPASALQLDTPWKCSYCQRGVKCPYITESIDVLKNLLSDDNETTTGDEDTGPVESEYEDELAKVEAGPVRRKKRKYRKRHYSRSAMIERRKTLRHNTGGPEISALVTSEHRSHLFIHDSGEERDDVCSSEIKPQTLTNDSTSGSERTDSASGRKRKRHHVLNLQKKLKRSSVESRTVSVTRIATPIYEDTAMNFLSALSPKDDSKSAAPAGGTEAGETPASGSLTISSPCKEEPLKVKQQKFRVSLSLSDDQKSSIKSPSSIQSWDGNSPTKNTKRSPSFDSDSCFYSPTSSQSSAMPFLASPLPTSTKLPGSAHKRIRTEAKDEGQLMVSVTTPVSVNESVSKPLNCSLPTSMHSDHSTQSVSKGASKELCETAKPASNSSATSPSMESGGAPITLTKLDSTITAKSASADVSEMATTVEATRQSSPASIHMDVGVTGSSSHSNTSTVNTNRVVVSSIQVNPPDKVKEGDSTKKLAPAPVQSPAQPVVTAQASSLKTNFTVNKTSLRELASEKVAVSPISSVQPPVSVQTKTPIATTMSVKAIKQPARASLPTAATQHKPVRPGVLPVSAAPEERSGPAQKPAGAPTPVITKNTPQARGGHPELPKEQIAKADRPTTNQIKEHLPVTTNSKGSCDPDVIITGVEPCMEDSRGKANNSKGGATTPNSVGNCAGTKQMRSKIVSPVNSSNPLSENEKSSRHSKVVPRGEKSESQTGQHLENRHVPGPAKLVPSTVHVLYSSDPASRPVARHTELSAAKLQHGSGVRLYHTPAKPGEVVAGSHGHHPSSVVTTKPYAIVNAIPSQSPDTAYKPIPLPQKPGAGTAAGHHVMQIVPATGSTAQQVDLGQPGYRGPPASSSAPPSLPPPPSYSSYIAEKKKDKVSTEDVQSIQKKIGDAFTQSSELMLVSAFEEAWKKFQENDKVYKQPPVISRSTDNPTTTAASVQQVSTKPQAVAPKPVAENLQVLPATSQYIHMVPQADAAAQQHLLVQQVPTEYTNVYSIPGNQVRVAGLYYPNVERRSQSDSHKIIMPKNPSLQNVVVQGDRPRLVGHGTTKLQPTTKSAPAPTTNPRARTKPAKKCSWCGATAIYLCSGCHQEWYCGNECQLKSWEVHSDHCKA